MATTPEHEIAIDNIGPITHVDIRLPEGGGAVIFRGVNGCGKSTAVDAIGKLTGDKGALSVRDKQLRGEVSGLGMRLVVAANTQRHGELVVETLDSGLSLGTLIDPGLKSAEAADARRIRSLVALSGEKADIKLFSSLLSEVEFLQFIDQHAHNADDLVTMAACVKRDIESHARRIEGEATKAKADAAAYTQVVGDVDLSEVIDEGTVQEALRLAMDAHAKLIAQRDAADAAGDASVRAKEMLKLAEESYEGGSMQQAQQILSKNQERFVMRERSFNAATADADDAHKAADQAESDKGLAANQVLVAERTLKAAEEHAKSMAAWREALEAEVPLAPEPGEISAAATTLDNAKAVFNRIPIIAKAKHSQWKADDALATYALRKAEGKRLREAAGGCDEVLSGIVGKLGSGLRVEAGRLVLDTDRGTTYFADLSDGERGRRAIDIAVAIAPKRSIFAVEQRVWEGLDPINRAAIVDQLVAKGVYMASAMPSDDATLVVETLPAAS